MTSISVILPFAILKVSALDNRPRGAITTPMAPFTSASCTSLASWPKATACFAQTAAPRTSAGGAPKGTARSVRTTRSGSKTASRPSKSPSRKRRKKGLNDLALPDQIGVGCPATAHAASRAAGELPRRLCRTAHDLRDLLERHREHVVQHERKALRRRQPFEHDQQREPDRIREERFVLGAAPARAGRDRLRRVRGERLLAPRGARPQHVEAHARHDGGQPSAKVVNACGLGAAESQPRFLNGVVDLAQRAEHPVGHGAQMGSVLFESLGQIIEFAHGSHSSRSVITLTDERHAM
jgi:hypothetical protein